MISPMHEDAVSFACPHCGIENTHAADFTGGKRQKFVLDCENCCHPILIRLEIREGEIENFTAEKE